MALIVAASGAYALSRFADQAFADSLGLRTVRVATDPLSWVASHVTGCSPVYEYKYSIRNPIYVVNMTDEYGFDFSKIFTVFYQKLTEEISTLPPGWSKQIVF